MPDWRSQIRARLAAGGVPPHDALVEELAQHLEQEYAELSTAIGPAAAEQQLSAHLDELTHRDEIRRRASAERPGAQIVAGARRSHLWHDLADDVAYALRRLRQSPVSAALTVVTIGLGIGATTAIFSVVSAVALRPIPVPDADRVVRMYETNPRTDTWSTSEPNYLDYSARTKAFAYFAAATSRAASLLDHGDPVSLSGLGVSASYFTLFGTRPIVGAPYGAANDRPGGDTHVVMLSEGIWRRLFGADPRVVGTTVNFDGVPFVVLGVMPARFGYYPADYWVPLAPDPSSNRGNHLLGGLARLKPGVTIAQANDDIKRVAAELSRLYPKSNGQWGARVENITDSVVGPALRRQLVVLFAAVGFLLLLACANVANLLLGRALVRQREISVRAALGADRGRIARQLFTESVMVSLLGAFLGIALTWLAIPLIRRGSTANVPRLDEVVVDARVLLFALVVAVLTGVLFGLAPALHATRVDIQGALRQGSRSIAGAGRRLRDALVAVEVALAVLLLVGAGLLGRSFVRLLQVPSGFAMNGAVQFTITAPNDMPRDQRAEYFHRIETAIAGAPGVASVGASSIAPFSGGNTNTQFLAEGHEATADEYFAADWRSVTPGFFKTLGVPLLRGRLLEETDIQGHPGVAVIDSTMAARLWPGKDPLGRHIMGAQSARRPEDWIEVVGVVRDVRDQSPATDPGPAVYFNESQKPWIQLSFFVKGSGQSGLAGLVDAVRHAIRESAPTTPVPDITPLTDNIDVALAPERFTAGLLGIFAAVALILAAIGLYGVISFNVQQRTTEMGVRLAFGATPARVQRLVMRDAGVVVAIGLVFGCIAAVLLGRLIASLLFATTTLDFATYGGVVLVIAVVAALASYVPAWRASRTDPLVAIREPTS